MKRSLLLSLCLLVTPFWLSAQCLIVHVSPDGSPEGNGMMSDPKDIQSAMAEAVEGSFIRMAAGLYELDQALPVMVNNLTIEGGFLEDDQWKKTSAAGATTLFRNQNNVIGQPLSPRISAIELVDNVGFRIQDVSIEVDDAPESTVDNPRGVSTYGVHLLNCSDYDFVRCRIHVGDASAGLDGVPHDGAGSAGGGGGGGTGGAEGDGCNNGSVGLPGSSGGPGGTGGAFGTPNPTNNCNLVNCGKEPSNGNPGSPGGNANAAEVSYTPGDQPNPPAFPIDGIENPFYIPADRTDGSDGFAGGGGGGGGGATKGTCCTCSCGSGNGNGGAGGAGGGAGFGGRGGMGGGGSFGVYVVNSPEGRFADCHILEGQAGIGGVGGEGQAGASGQPGSAGGTFTRCGETRSGGTGGNGGNGSDGGRGRDGANGINAQLYIFGDTPQFSNASVNVNVNEGENTIDGFDLDGQEVVIASYNRCAVSDVTLETLAGGSPEWTFFSGGSFESASGSEVTFSPPVAGATTFSVGDHVYGEFLFTPCFANTTVNVEGITAIAEAAGAVYQWYVCDDELQAISGATGQSFTAGFTGDFAVEVTENGCTAISECVNIMVVNVAENTDGVLNIYPNPARAHLTVTTERFMIGQMITLHDQNGRMVLSDQVQSEQTVLDVSNLSRGMYVLTIGDDVMNTYKIIKQ